MRQVAFKSLSVFELKYRYIATFLVFRPIFVSEAKVDGLTNSDLSD